MIVAVIATAAIAAAAVIAVGGDRTSAPQVGTTATTTIVPGGLSGEKPTAAELARVIWPPQPTSFFDAGQAAQAYAVTFLRVARPMVAVVRAPAGQRREVDLLVDRSTNVVTVGLMRLPGQPWWSVVSTTTPAVLIGDPGPGETIASPVFVHGVAGGAARVVEVEVREDGAAAALGRATVPVKGRAMAPFGVEVPFSPASVQTGSIVVFIRSPSGLVTQAAVQRVTFMGTR